MLQDLSLANGVLDLACGRGRNGLFLIRNNVPVTFADNSEGSLGHIGTLLDEYPVDRKKLATTWQVDLEQNGSRPLADKSFDAILVFNYLHRPIMDEIKQAIRPGGLIFYETFTVEQRQFGRPSNPDFLLQLGELRNYFEHWEILHDFEGLMADPDRAMASLIARRP